MSKKEIMEIERKWALWGLPLLLSHRADDIIELDYAFEGNIRYGRRTFVKQRDEGPKIRHCAAIKEGRGISRKETTWVISPEEFQEKRQNPDLPTLSKTRYLVPSEIGLLEIDDYKDLRLITLEIEIEAPLDDFKKVKEEFKNKELLFPFDWDHYIIDEVTELEGFKNINLAKKFKGVL